MTPEQRLAHARRLPQTDRSRRERIYAALDDMTADQLACGVRLVTELEKPHPFSHYDTPIEPEPIEINLSMTANTDNVRVIVEATR